MKTYRKEHLELASRIYELDGEVYQLLGSGHGCHAEAADATGRRTCFFGSSGNDPGSGQGAAQSFGVGRKHNGITGFQGDECLVTDGGGGVGAGHDGANDAYRHTDLP